MLTQLILLQPPGVKRSQALLYFLVLTHACNLHCAYCGYGEGYIESEPTEIGYTVEDLRKFMVKDPEPSIVFYGGEPLLRQSLMERVMDSIPANAFILQTNALNLGDMKPEYLRRFNAILVSIDGRKETTDHYRGTHVYDRILDNLRLIRHKGFTGDLVARMTVSEQTQIFQDVMHLASLVDPRFDHIHWQLDALWDSPPDLRWKDFERWLMESYNPGVLKLAKAWGDTIIGNRKVLPIVPFTGIMWTILNGTEVGLRCGSGMNSFGVATSGNITVCPIALEWDFARVGSIFQSEPKDLPYKVRIGSPCTTCDVVHICGGRCLFANKTKLWGEAGYQKICRSTNIMITELTKLKPQITEMISKKEIPKEEFNYPSFNNGLEVIP